jgi:hypothetical protein
VLSLFIFFNLGIAVYYFPYLMKTMLGIDTVFTLSRLSVFNTTFLIIISGLTYLIVDPLLKTVYTLRFFYVFSVKSGDDIRTDMLNLKAAGKGVAFILFFIILTACSNAVASEKTDAGIKHPSPVNMTSPREIDDSIEKVTRHWEFAWRMQDKKIDEDNNGIGTLERFILWIKGYIEPAGKYIIKKIKEWIKKFLALGD